MGNECELGAFVSGHKSGMEAPMSYHLSAKILFHIDLELLELPGRL